jgi:hypothetical protein
MRAVEFTAATVEFCRNASAVGLTEKAFRAWLALPANVATFPNLAIHLGIKKPAKPGTVAA